MSAPAGLRWLFPSLRLFVLSTAMLVSGFLGVPGGYAQSGVEDAVEAADAPADDSEKGVQALFADFLHYARMGRFEEARAYATRLLDHPDLDPVELLEWADRDRGSLDTLITVISHSSVGREAQRVLDVLREGEHLKRQDPQRIGANIDKLGGAPQAEYHAIQALRDSGEYAVPWMVQVLVDRSREDLAPRIIRTLPQIGQPAVNPLVAALETADLDLQQTLVRALGEIGYPHAVPYLKKLFTEGDLPDGGRAAVDEALARIARQCGRSFPGSAAEDFIRLAEQYYNEEGVLRADPRLPSANLWYWRDGFVDSVVVPRDIHGPIMAMRCAEYALRLEPARVESIPLWLAANIRREAYLGMNVESGEPVVSELDPSRPDGFPRALYFSRAAGAQHCLDVLDRANRDQDTLVALGAIAALRTVAGPSALVAYRGATQPLVQALTFPDASVRIKAALALAEARPRASFSGADWVIPVLTEALGHVGEQFYIVVDPDSANLNRIVELLRQQGAEVLGESNFYKAVEQVRKDRRLVAGVFLSAAMENPGVWPAVAELRREFRYRLTPVVLLRDSVNYETARTLAEKDPRVGHVAADAESEALAATMREVMARTGRVPPPDDQSQRLALAATDALLGLAHDPATVLSAAVSQPALIAVLEDADDDELRRRTTAVLARLDGPTAQRALVATALSDTEHETLRVASFDALAESARIHGNLLSDTLLTRLIEVASDEPDLALRTAASQALGALNLTDNKAGEVIRKYHQG
ncbi:MAG: hypothetical protein GY842_02205 [bacterium]|nr:hypothetical protein [bacterium]